MECEWPTPKRITKENSLSSTGTNHHYISFKAQTCLKLQRPYAIQSCLQFLQHYPKICQPPVLRFFPKEEFFPVETLARSSPLTLTNNEIYRILHNINNNRFLGNKVDHQSKNKFKLSSFKSVEHSATCALAVFKTCNIELTHWPLLTVCLEIWKWLLICCLNSTTWHLYEYFNPALMLSCWSRVLDLNDLV